MDNNISSDACEPAKGGVEWEALYDNYAAVLYGTILQFIPEKSIAERVLLDSFLQIIRQLPQHHPTSGSIFCWMLRITLQECKKIAGVQDADILRTFLVDRSGTIS